MRRIPFSSPARRTRRHRSDRGAAIVELSIMALLLITLVMGIIDFGTLFNQRIGLQNGAREAVWNGSRSIVGAPATCGLNLGATPASGSAQDNTARVMCMAKRRTPFPASETAVKVRIVDMANPTGPAPAWGPGAGVMVCMMRQATSTTGFFDFLMAGRVHKVRLTNIVTDPSLVNGLTTLAEAPLAGSNWNWCDNAASTSPNV